MIVAATGRHRRAAFRIGHEHDALTAAAQPAAARRLVTHGDELRPDQVADGRRERVRRGRFLPALLVALLAGCAATTVAPYAGDAPRDETLYLIAGGWHTEIGLSREAASALSPQLMQAFPEARYLVFGWGERNYYTSAHPTSGAALRALLPGPAVLLVVPLAVAPDAAFGSGNVLALLVSQPGVARLARYLSLDIALDSEGMPRRVAAGPSPGSVFYESTGTYSAARTCNTWTAEALHVAGLPVSAAGVILASQVLNEARPLARAAEPR